MVTLNEIRIALREKDYPGLRALHLRALHFRAKSEGIEHCDSRKLSTVNLQVIECSVFKGTSPGHERTLVAMLDAVERGNHPYEDDDANAVMGADAAIAQAQLDAWVKPGKRA